MIRQKLKNKAYFEMAKSIALLSRDEKHKVGAVIIDVDGKVISTGYNGPPTNVNDCEIDFSGNEFLTEIDVLSMDSNLNKLFNSNERSELPIIGRMGFPYLQVTTKKSPFMIHSEMNAILSTDDRSRLKGATIYMTHVPCAECAKTIAQVGIKNVKTLDNKAKSFKDFIFNTLAIFNKSRIKFEVFTDEELK